MTAPGSSMYLTALKTMVRDLTFQSSTDTGLYTETTLATYIQIAHRELYNFISHLTPSLLVENSGDKSITSTGLALASDGLDADSVNVIYKVEWKQSGSTNYTLVDPMDSAEIGDTDSSTSVISSSNAIYRWYMVGETMYLHPKPASAETIRIYYIAGATDVSDSVYPFGGKLPQYHYLVAWRAADLILAKDERFSTFHQTYLEMKKELAEQIRRRHVTSARRVRMSPWED